MQEKMLGLRTTIYQVNDLAEAKEWYTKAFGQAPYFDEVFYVGFNIGGYELGIQPSELSAESKNNAVVSYWGVENIEKTYAKFLDLGASPQEPPQNVGGEIQVATVKDPWGNHIGLIYNPEFALKD